jgi:Arc/MetJ-type ribon-helix-helix transcriptional regulator
MAAGLAIAGAIIAFIAQNLVPWAINEGQQNWGASLKNRANELAKKVYAQLMKNNTTKEKLIDAYNNKNGDLLNSLVNQSGYANQAEVLREAISKERAKYKENLQKVNEENKELTNTYNTIQNASAQAGLSYGSNYSAQNTLDSIENLVNGGAESNG